MHNIHTPYFESKTRSRSNSFSINSESAQPYQTLSGGDDTVIEIDTADPLLAPAKRYDLFRHPSRLELPQDLENKIFQFLAVDFKKIHSYLVNGTVTPEAIIEIQTARKTLLGLLRVSKGFFENSMRQMGPAFFHPAFSHLGEIVSQNPAFPPMVVLPSFINPANPLFDSAAPMTPEVMMNTLEWLYQARQLSVLSNHNSPDLDQTSMCDQSMRIVGISCLLLLVEALLGYLTFNSAKHAFDFCPGYGYDSSCSAGYSSVDYCFASDKIPDPHRTALNCFTGDISCDKQNCGLMIGAPFFAIFMALGFGNLLRKQCLRSIRYRRLTTALSDAGSALAELLPTDVQAFLSESITLLTHANSLSASQIQGRAAAEQLQRMGLHPQYYNRAPIIDAQGLRRPAVPHQGIPLPPMPRASCCSCLRRAMNRLWHCFS